MATRSSYFLAALLIANPFMLVFFQNCSQGVQARKIATDHKQQTVNHADPEIAYKVNKNLIIK